MIMIPSKSDKEASELRDGLRILAWNQYKIDNQLKGDKAYTGYEDFAEEWRNHEIQAMELKELQKMIKELGYSVDEIKQIRTEYYQKKDKLNVQETVNSNGHLEQEMDNIPY